MPLNHGLPDVPRTAVDPGVYELLQAMRRLVLDNSQRIDDFDPSVSALRAEVAALRAEVEALKAAPPP